MICWLIILFSGCTMAAAEEKIDPIEHYANTGEWISGSDAAETEASYGETYSTPEEAEAARRNEEEEELIRKWEKLDETIQLRRYDELAFEARKDFDEAKNVPAPFASPQGYILFPYGSVVPRITCRPYRVTDIALEPGEEILGIHAGDTVRWLFAPSVSMQNELKVSHIVVKPSMPGISTNLMVHTDRRAYQIDLLSTESGMYTPGVAFSYADQDLNRVFGATQNRNASFKKEQEVQADVISMDIINSGYKIIARYVVDWKPLSVFDDGLKTYIRMSSRISEAPALYIYLDGKDTLVNYRVKGRYYIVDRLFDRAYLRIGSRKVTIVRNETLARQNMLSDEIEAIRRDEK